MSKRLGGLGTWRWLLHQELTGKTPPCLDLLEAKVTVSRRSEASQMRTMGVEESSKVSFFGSVAFLSWTLTIRVI